MTTYSRRAGLLAAGVAVALISSSTAAAAGPVHPTKPTHAKSGKVVKGGKGGTIRFSVAGQVAGTEIANLCDAMKVTQVKARKVKSDGVLVGKTRTMNVAKGLAYDSWNVTEADTTVTSYCDVTYTHKNLAVGKGLYYRLMVDMTCVDSAACVAANLVTDGTTTPATTLAADARFVTANTLETAAVEGSSLAQLHFEKSKVSMRNKAKLKRSMVKIAYVAPVI